MSSSTLWSEAQLTGLTAAEVADRRRRGLVNAAARSHIAEYGRIVRRNVFTLLNCIIVPAAVALYRLDDFRGCLAISGMALVNTVMGLIQEIRAKRHLDRLAILNEARATVLRDGQILEVVASTVVLDDLLVLTTGSAIVADGTLLAARSLEVDESLLTGESDPLQKPAGERLLSGSYCVMGEGIFRVEQVGKNSYAQSLTAAARQYHHVASPLQKNIQTLIRGLTALTVLLCFAYALLQKYVGYGNQELVQMIAATITSMIPQGLVLMATLAFVLGAVRLSKRGALVQKLHAVETMASVNVLCLDKTGTLTTNRLQLHHMEPLTKTWDLAEIRRRVQLFASASLDRQNKSVAALLAALGEVSCTRLNQLPFKSQNRFSAVHVQENGEERVLFLGAVEALGPFLHETPPTLPALAREAACQGHRVLLFTEGQPQRAAEGELKPMPLTPLALILLRDELRAEAKPVLEELLAQGIDIKIISGDNHETVRATVRQLSEHLGEPDGVSGQRWDQAVDKPALAKATRVFGRVAPRQKAEIVSALQAQGLTVAMIGDGVNDVLPIKQAQLGIAMGEGSQAARTVADLVLATNDFSLLPETLAEGRLILRNLRRSGKVFLVKNVYTLFLIILAVIVCSLPFPYLPQQVTLLNVFTIGLPTLLMTTTRGRAAMAHPGSWLREVGTFALWAGGITGFVCLAVYVLGSWDYDRHSLVPRTMTLTMLIFIGQALMLRALTEHEPKCPRPERRFYYLAFFSVVAYGALMQLPISRDFFRLTPLRIEEWSIVLAASIVVILGLWSQELFHRLWARFSPTPSE